MRAFLVAAVVAIAVATGASFVLESYQQSTGSAFATTGVRL